jgi:hypothetical protein
MEAHFSTPSKLKTLTNSSFKMLKVLHRRLSHLYQEYNREWEEY